MGTLSLKKQRVFSHIVTDLMYFCNNLITTLGNCADFTNWDFSVLCFPESVSFCSYSSRHFTLSSSPLFISQCHCAVQYVCVYVCSHTHTLPVSGRPGYLFQSSVSSVEQVAVQGIEMQTAELRQLSHLHFRSLPKTTSFKFRIVLMQHDGDFLFSFTIHGTASAGSRSFVHI